MHGTIVKREYKYSHPMVWGMANYWYVYRRCPLSRIWCRLEGKIILTGYLLLALPTTEVYRMIKFGWILIERKTYGAISVSGEDHDKIHCKLESRVAIVLLLYIKKICTSLPSPAFLTSALLAHLAYFVHFMSTYTSSLLQPAYTSVDQCSAVYILILNFGPLL